MWRVCSLLALSLALATPSRADVTLYGTVRADVEVVRLGSRDRAEHLVRVVNNSSYLGFRAQEELRPSLRAWAQIEGAVGVDDGSGAFAGRNTGVGLSSRAGTLLIGQWDSPYKSATGFLDPFSGTTDGVYLGVLGGNVATVAGADASTRVSFERRARNVVQVWSPSTLAPVEARWAVGLGESSAIPTVALSAGSLAWRSDGFSAGAAYEDHRGWQAGQRDRAVKGYGQWAAGNQTSIGLVAEHIRWRGSLSTVEIKGRSLPADLSGASWAQVDAVLVALQHHAGPWHLNLSVGTDFGVKTSLGRLAHSRAHQVAAGIAYSLGPRTELCGLYARIGNAGASANSFGSNRIAVTPGTDLVALGAGVVHRF